MKRKKGGQNKDFADFFEVAAPKVAQCKFSKITDICAVFLCANPNHANEVGRTVIDMHRYNQECH